MREALPRAAFLRLKFSKLDEAEEHLQENKVTYRKDPVAYRRERHYAALSPDGLVRTHMSTALPPTNISGRSRLISLNAGALNGPPNQNTRFRLGDSTIGE